MLGSRAATPVNFPEVDFSAMVRMNPKHLIKRLLLRAGYEVSRAGDGAQPFHSWHYLRHTSRRLEHLASLSIPIFNTSVLEAGAGVGDHSHYYLDRGCQITITEARP